MFYKGVGDLSQNYFGRLQRGAADRGITFEVTIEYLWELFQSQNGRCALSGVPIKLSTRHSSRTNKREQTASLDRINPDVGYCEGNVWFVHKDVNYMKLDYTLEEFLFFCAAVTDYQRSLDNSVPDRIEHIVD